MALARAVAAIGLTLAASVALSLGIGATAEQPETPPRAASVVWDDRPRSAAALAADAAVLVKARVTAIEDGPPLLSPHPDLPTKETAIPTQRIAFETIEVLAGQIPPAFKLFKTGSPQIYLKGDPLYSVGERYVLFLEPHGEPGAWVPSAPDGRLRLDAQGEADPVIGGPVGTKLDGKTPEQIEREAGQ